MNKFSLKEYPIDVLNLTKVIWDYMIMNHGLVKKECIFVLCSNDKRVAEYAAELFHKGLGEYIVFSGGFGNFTEGVFEKTEAETFGEIALSLSVPADKIILEKNATNTGENVKLTLSLLKSLGITPKSWLLVQKPFMERRTYGTFLKQLPNSDAIVTSPPIPFAEYPNEFVTTEDLINTIVGDAQRVLIYPNKGYMVEQNVPKNVSDAIESLINLGFNKHTIK